MPDTPIYSLPYEQTPTDQPGITLHGGTSGTEDILAEAVETELERIDTDISDVQAQLARGWTPIDSGDESGAFTIDLTAGGEFPAGTFERIKVGLRGSLSGATLLNVRVNSDSTADLHRHGWVITDPNDGASDGNNATTGTAWPVAQWGTEPSCIATLEILATDISSLLGYQSTGARQGSNANRRRTDVTGDLANNRLINSLQFFPTSGSISTCRWWAEGYRP